MVLGEPSTLGITLTGARMGGRLTDLVVTGIARCEAFLSMPKTKAADLVVDSLEESV